MGVLMFAAEPHTFSDAVIIATIAAIPPTLMAAAALIASLRNGQAAGLAAVNAKRAVVKARRLAKAVDDNTVLTEEIKKQTNGTQTATIDLLRSLIEKMHNQDAALLELNQRMVKVDEQPKPPVKETTAAIHEKNEIKPA